MRDVLDRAAQNIEGRFSDQPLVEAAVRTSIGTAYGSLGEYDEAQQHLEARATQFVNSNSVTTTAIRFAMSCH